MLNTGYIYRNSDMSLIHDSDSCDISLFSCPTIRSLYIYKLDFASGPLHHFYMEQLYEYDDLIHWEKSSENEYIRSFSDRDSNFKIMEHGRYHTGRVMWL